MRRLWRFLGRLLDRAWAVFDRRTENVRRMLLAIMAWLAFSATMVVGQLGPWWVSVLVLPLSFLAGLAIGKIAFEAEKWAEIERMAREAREAQQADRARTFGRSR